MLLLIRLNIKKNILTQLKTIMNSGKKKVREYLGLSHTQKLKI